MKLQVIPASEWVTYPESYKEAFRQFEGVAPVNDVFLPLWGNTNPVNLLFGGFGSGKSVFVAEEKIRKCVETDYFRCYYGRKVFDTVRGSQFATLTDVIEDMRLQNRFTYSKADNSSMVIHLKGSGNKFIPFGGDKPEKLKSIKDPTDFWCEEFDQFTQDDFNILFSRLRTTKAVTQFDGTFNTSPVYENHWIKKAFFDPVEPPPMPVNKTFANYPDNYFINQEAYYQKLKLASIGDPLLLEAIANGAWGVINNKNPWLFNWDNAKHVSADAVYRPGFPAFASFDFNTDPVTCTIWQMSPSLATDRLFVHCIDEFGGEVRINDLCEKVLSRYPSTIFYVTGDMSGNKNELGYNSKHDTLYNMIQKYMMLSPAQMQQNKYNLEHENSRFLCNALFYHLPDLKIHPKCTNLINDCRIAKVDEKAFEKSGKPNQLQKDRELYKMDYFDTMRYFFQRYLYEFARVRYLDVKKAA